MKISRIAKTILTEHQQDLGRVAQALLDKESLDTAAFNALLQQNGQNL